MHGDLIDTEMAEGSQEPSLEQLQIDLENYQSRLAIARVVLYGAEVSRDSRQAALQETFEWREYDAEVANHRRQAEAELELYNRVRDLAKLVYNKSGKASKKITPYVSAKETRKYEITNAYHILCWALQREYRAMVEDLNEGREYQPHLIKLDEKAFLEYAKFYLEGVESGAVTINQIPFPLGVVEAKDDVTIAVAKNLSKLLEE